MSSQAALAVRAGDTVVAVVGCSCRIEHMIVEVVGVARTGMRSGLLRKSQDLGSAGVRPYLPD